MNTIGYIGSYTKKDGKGIYRFELDEVKGEIDKVETAYQVEASTYLTQTEDFLYAITKDGEKCGVASFKKDNEGNLTFINQCLSSEKGTGCYISVTSNHQYLLEAVYGAGLVRIYQLNPETGEVERLIEEIEHKYETGTHERQDQSHVHYIKETPDKQYVLATDLGTDRIITYAIDNNGLKPVGESLFKNEDGPRHIEFHKNGKYAYVVHELSNYISVTEYQDGELHEMHRYLTLPEDFKGDSKLAAVRISNDQQFIYVSNRGHDSIAIFKVLDNGADIELVDIVKSEGEFPRDFNITDSDNYLVCAHQEGNGVISVFKRDKSTGSLTLTDHHQHAPEGVFVTFAL